MHFAYPPRKSSHPPPYAVRPARSQFSARRRWQLQFLAVVLLSALTFTYFLFKLFYRHDGVTISTVEGSSGSPPVVIVTVLEEGMDDTHRDIVMNNRQAYVERHGYGLFTPNSTDYKVGKSPQSWSKLPAMRHAMTIHPTTSFFWHLGPRALIMNEDLSLEKHLLESTRLQSLMLGDIPVVPPDSVIKTSKTLTPDKVDAILTQDKQGVSVDSFVVRQGEWSQFFLDAWFNPLYRSYNYQKAELHALEHLIQWHGTILAKLAFVPLTAMNAYAKETAASGSDGVFTEGDLVANFVDCHRSEQGCVEEISMFVDRLRQRQGQEQEQEWEHV